MHSPRRSVTSLSGIEAARKAGKFAPETSPSLVTPIQRAIRPSATVRCPGASAVRLKEVSGCDGVMLGRGALGNPWIYREVEASLRRELPPATPDLLERKKTLLEHMELQCRYEERPLGPLRRIICWYFKETVGAKIFRDSINRAETVEEMKALIEATFRS